MPILWCIEIVRWDSLVVWGMGAQHVQYDQIAHIAEPMMVMGGLSIRFLSNVMWVFQQMDEHLIQCARDGFVS